MHQAKTRSLSDTQQFCKRTILRAEALVRDAIDTQVIGDAICIRYSTVLQAEALVGFTVIEDTINTACERKRWSDRLDTQLIIVGDALGI